MPAVIKQLGRGESSKGRDFLKLWIVHDLCFFPLSGEAAKVRLILSSCKLLQLFSQALLDSTEEITKGEDYDVLEPWLGRGLLMRLILLLMVFQLRQSTFAADKNRKSERIKSISARATSGTADESCSLPLSISPCSTGI